MFLKVFAVVMK